MSGWLFVKDTNERNGINTNFENRDGSIRRESRQLPCCNVGQYCLYILRQCDLHSDVIRCRLKQSRFKLQNLLESGNRNRIGIQKASKIESFIGWKGGWKCACDVAIDENAEGRL